VELATSYPVTDLGTDVETLRKFAVGVEEAGYEGLFISEHILGADLKLRPDWRPYNHVLQGPGEPIYDYQNPFFEPFVAFGYLAAVTKRIKLGTGVMVLGIRQTALIAKQAAIADVLSGGRVILGIGTGWNDVEYEAMGVDFHTRGKRVDEQIVLLRQLWTQDTVSFEGKFHTVRGAGINPLPVQRPIPLWIAGASDAAVKRAALLGDGYYPGLLPDAAEAARLERIRKLASEARRDPAKIAVLGAVTQGPREPEQMVKGAQRWQQLGATHLTVRTSTHPVVWPKEMPPTERSALVEKHLDALRRFKQAWDNR
jgi:probable F420-dependent oxidoreductase